MDKKSAPAEDRAIKILAQAIYRELRARGFDQRAVVVLITEMVELVQQELRERTPRRV